MKRVPLPCVCGDDDVMHVAERGPCGCGCPAFLVDRIESRRRIPLRRTGSPRDAPSDATD